MYLYMTGCLVCIVDVLVHDWLSSVCACMVDMLVWMLVLGSAEPLCMQQRGILLDNRHHSRIAPGDVKC